ncbi:LpqB family beta-propeller domain-containing protein [candidate division KSB1 bacterium]
MKNSISLLFALIIATSMLLSGCGPGSGIPAIRDTYEPAWSPNGGLIAFSHHGDIWTVPVAGGQATQLTQEPGQENWPEWSADGNHLYYLAGGEIKRLPITEPMAAEAVVSAEQPITRYSLSPDGNRIAFISGGLLMISVDPHSGQAQTVEGLPRLSNNSIDWTPDGELVAITARSEYSHRNYLYLADLDTGVAGEVGYIDAMAYLPRISPDGQLVACSFLGQNHDLWVMPCLPVGGIGRDFRRQLTHWEEDETAPDFSPDGRRVVFQSSHLKHSDLYLMDLAEGSTPAIINISGKQYLKPTGRLRLRVFDEETKEPMAARYIIRDSDGKGYAPPDAFFHLQSGSGGGGWFHYESEMQFELPVGKYTVIVQRGIEYEPKETTWEHKETSRKIDLTLKRWVDMAEEAWYSGEDHIHANYGGTLHKGYFYISPEEISLAGQAEDLNVANVMVANWGGPRVFDRKHFTGKPHVLSTDENIVYYSQEFRNSASFGHLIILKLRELIEPMMTGFHGSIYPAAWPANVEIAREAHARGGFVTYPHPYSKGGVYDQVPWGAFELPVDAALGEIDAMSFMGYWIDKEVNTGWWYRMLNCGIRIGPSAGNDVFINRLNSQPIGGDRSYVKLPGGLDYDSWVEGLRSQRCFVTNGPMIEFQVNGQAPGSRIKTDRDAIRIKIRASARSFNPISHLELIVNGKVRGTGKIKSDGRNAVLETSLRLNQSSWVAVRIKGPRPKHLVDNMLFAHSAPIYVYIGEEEIAVKEDARFLRNWCREVFERVDGQNLWYGDEHRRQVKAVYDEAQAYYNRIIKIGQ